MTEAEWLVCDDPGELLGLLRTPTPQTPLPERKSRLFGLACCERIQPLVTDERSQRAVQVVAQYAEGLATKEDLTSAFNSAFDVGPEFTDRADVRNNPNVHAACAATEACHPDELAEAVAGEAARAAEAAGLPSETPIQVNFIHCIFGNPFRPVAFAPAWRTATVVSLASGIYAERAFDRLPILADALEEAGCDHADVLAHCRGPGPHARGCWVVDGVLGKS